VPGLTCNYVAFTRCLQEHPWLCGKCNGLQLLIATEICVVAYEQCVFSPLRNCPIDGLELEWEWETAPELLSCSLNASVAESWLGCCNEAGADSWLMILVDGIQILCGASPLYVVCRPAMLSYSQHAVGELACCGHCDVLLVYLHFAVTMKLWCVATGWFSSGKPASAWLHRWSSKSVRWHSQGQCFQAAVQESRLLLPRREWHYIQSVRSLICRVTFYN